VLVELVACEGCGWKCEPAELEPGPSGDPHCEDCMQTLAANSLCAY